MTQKGIWLNAARARRVTHTPEFTNAIQQLWPNGTRMSMTKFEQVDAQAARNDHSIDWHRVATRLLTHDGTRRFDAERTDDRELRVAEAVALDRADAWRLTAQANWRRRYQITRSDRVDGDAYAAWTELEAEHRRRRRDAMRPLRRRDARRLGELAREHARHELYELPPTALLKPGEVLVTSNTLEELGSCGTYVDRFRSNWPEGTVITKELCVEHASSFEWHWAAANLLAPGHLSDWERRAERVFATGSDAIRNLDAEYRQHGAELRRQLNARAISRAQYDDKVQQAATAHDRRFRELRVSRDAAYAIAFAELYAEVPNPRLPELA